MARTGDEGSFHGITEMEKLVTFCVFNGFQLHFFFIQVNSNLMERAASIRSQISFRQSLELELRFDLTHFCYSSTGSRLHGPLRALTWNFLNTISDPGPEKKDAVNLQVTGRSVMELWVWKAKRVKTKMPVLSVGV